MPLEQVSALVLDDNANMRELLRAILEGFGCEKVEAAESCAEAVKLIDSYDFDLAFVDMKLVDMTGLEFCRQIRSKQTGRNAYLPLIMVTAYSERSRVIDAINAGVDEFLVKPIRPVDVANRVNAVIERRRPFVRTANYFGPDRRRRDDPRYAGPWRRYNDPGAESSDFLI